MLTFYAVEPDFHEREVNEAYHHKNEQHEHVANYFSRADGKSTRHFLARLICRKLMEARLVTGRPFDFFY